ncbi:hypothetical protein BgiBS90_018319, partial [Biomphalaria glabrata]
MHMSVSSFIFTTCLKKRPNKEKKKTDMYYQTEVLSDRGIIRQRYYQTEVLSDR